MAVFLTLYAQAQTRPFITTWQTSAANESITIPTAGDGYNYTVNWGDNSTDNNTYTGAEAAAAATHEYATSGTYTVTISGAFPRIRFSQLINSRLTSTLATGQIRTVEQWGDQAWTSMESAFAGCSDLTFNTTDAPDLSGVMDMSHMFRESSFKGDISDWNVSSVTNMYWMFGESSFNGNISNWNVSSVTDMRVMFYLSPFNGDISKWNTSSVTRMADMFNNNAAFNGDISNWNVSSVTNMDRMFLSSSSFNGDISKWNTSSVTSTKDMFHGSSFNQDLSEWNVSSVTDMRQMFRSSPFNQDLSKWDISSVTQMTAMFRSNSSISSENYDKLLIGWSTLDEDEAQIPSTIIFFSAPKRYSCRGKMGRDTLTMRYRWRIRGDELIPIRTDAAALSAFIAQCEVTADNLTAPTANNKCDGTGTKITATHSIPADVFPITSDTVVIWTYTDNGKSIVQTQQVTIRDTEAPMPGENNLPMLTAACPLAADEVPIPTATDNCDDGPITATTMASPPISESTTITWTYTDASGNTSTQTQQVTIRDMEAPMPAAADLPMLEDCSQITSLTVPVGTDNCDGPVTATTTTVVPISESTMITWAYTDVAGNMVTQMQQVTIGDTEAPTPDLSNDLSEITSSGSPVTEADVTVPTATDNCEDGPIMATTNAVFPITSSITITWTYTDAAGNMSTQTQEVTITPLGVVDDVLEAVVFPNPSVRYVEVRSPISSTFQLLSLSGKPLLEGTTNTKVDISSLQSGLYLVQLSDGRLLKFVRE